MSTVIEVAVVVVVLAFAVAMMRWEFQTPITWTKRAEKLAAAYGVASRPDVDARVARHLRRQAILTVVVNVVVLSVLNVSSYRLTDAPRHHRYVTAYTLSLIALPVLTIAYGLAIAYPAWNRAQARRVTHLSRPRLSQIFTTGERALLGVGVLVAVAAGSWGLWRVQAHGWWLLWLGTLAASALVWRWAALTILTRPAQASDEAELEWDDVLRHKEARELTIAAAWAPALVAIVLDWTLAQSGNLLPLYAVVAIGVVIAQTFKQGRQLWKQS